MLVYNITTKVNHPVVAEWIQWQKEEHIPGVMATGLFAKYVFYKLLGHDDHEGATYIIQYETDSREKYDEFLKKFADEFRDKAFKRWGNSFITFRSLLEPVQ